MSQATPQDPLLGQVLAERFEILERLGDGGTGVVYKAKQLSVDRIIAVKVLGAHVSTDQQWIRRFQNEARAASRLEHPNTVRVIDFGQTREGLLYIAMEYLHGRSLRAEIERVRRLPSSRVLHIVSQVCGSLAEAHAQGIIHRDIKPDNIYLVEKKGDGGDVVKVLDFSVAKLDTPEGQLTRAGVVFGTPAYMSPEQGRGVTLDPRSDIYAVGIVAYEMLSGRPPFEHQLPTEVVLMHLRRKPAPLADVPPPVAELVMRTLEKDPARRPQNADQLARECQQISTGLVPQSPSGGGHSSAKPQSQTPAAPPGDAVPVAIAVADERTKISGSGLPRLGAPPPLGPPPALGAPAPRSALPPRAPPRIAPMASGAPPPAAPPRIAPSSPRSARPTAQATEGRTIALPSTDLRSTGLPRDSPDGTVTQLESPSGVDPPRAAMPMHGVKKKTIAAPFFWAAWVFLGIGAGVAIHVFWLNRGGS